VQRVGFCFLIGRPDPFRLTRFTRTASRGPLSKEQRRRPAACRGGFLVSGELL